VPAAEAAALAQRLRVAFGEHVALGQPLGRLAREHQCGADPAVDVDRRVRGGGARASRERDELVAAVAESLGQVLDHARPLDEAAAQQTGAADLARVRHRARGVQAVARDTRHRITGDRVDHLGAGGAAVPPAALGPAR
jgi:hypothetical protein